MHYMYIYISQNKSEGSKPNNYAVDQNGHTFLIRFLFDAFD